jgi:LCP family protein required for cell wall assembly
MRIWAGLIAAGLLGLIGWYVARAAVLSAVTSPFILGVIAVLLVAVAVAWPVLVVDAWRLSRPELLPRRARLGLTGLLIASVLLTSLPLIAGARRSWAAADLINGVFGAGSASAAVDGRYNVLLMGGDAGADRIGTRPDSMTLASIDVDTGRTVLFSLPRNLENVKFAPGSPAAKAMPEGWSCGDECLLNGLYTWGAEHRSLFPGAADPGAEAMKEAIAGVTGLTVNYFVLIDLRGFRRLIDAVGGIDVTVPQRVPIGGETSRVSGYIEPGAQHLDGYHALWFARSRHGASDYARMARQRCVMDAMLHQLDPTTVLDRFQQLASAGKEVMSTDIPATELATFIDLGTKAKSRKITSVQFVPPLINPAYPDFAVIQDRVRTTIDNSEHPADTVAGSGSSSATTPSSQKQSGTAVSGAQGARSAQTTPPGISRAGTTGTTGATSTKGAVSATSAATCSPA